MLQIISANRLTDGLIVFRDARGGWNTSFASAAVLASKEEAAAALEAAKADVVANVVIEVEAVEVRDAAGGLVPVTMRDRIRVSGPSILQPKASAAAPVKSEQNDVSI